MRGIMYFVNEINKFTGRSFLYIRKVNGYHRRIVFWRGFARNELRSLVQLVPKTHKLLHSLSGPPMIIDLISIIYSSTLLCSWFIKFVASTRADRISLHPGYLSMGPTVWGSENRGVRAQSKRF